MQIATNKESLYINKEIGEKYDTAIVEEDYIVPDIKPDILSTIHTSGVVCIYKKEILDGKIRLDGCINTYIMYLADDENANVRGLNTNIEFSKTIDFDGIKEDMMIENSLMLKTIECRVLNGRKVNIKAIIDVNLKVFSNEEVEFVNSIEDVRDIELLNENININSLIGNGMTKTYAKDTIMIDAIDNLSEILKVDINIINKEIKVSYNKVLVKADACVKIMYLTDDNRVCKTTQIIPVMGFVDMPDITDDDICDVNFEIKNLVVKPNNIEEHSIYVEVEMEIVCNAYKMKQVNLIQDLYSPSINLNYNQKKIKAISEKCITKDICSIRENQTIPEIGNNRLYDVEVAAQITKQTILKDRIIYEGELQLGFIFEGNTNRNIDTKNLTIPFNYNMNCPGASQNSKIETNIEITLQDFTIISDQNIDMKIDLEFIANMSNPKVINVIEEITVDETRDDDRHSLVIYFIKPGDTLWNIAKKFHSTMENIAMVNQIEDKDKLKIGEQLFIPISI